MGASGMRAGWYQGTAPKAQQQEAPAGCSVHGRGSHQGRVQGFEITKLLPTSGVTPSDWRSHALALFSSTLDIALSSKYRVECAANVSKPSSEYDATLNGAGCVSFMVDPNSYSSRELQRHELFPTEMGSRTVRRWQSSECPGTPWRHPASVMPELGAPRQCVVPTCVVSAWKIRETPARIALVGLGLESDGSERTSR